MARQFERTVGVPVKYDMLYVGEWKQNLLLADHYGKGRVFLAGDSVHLVIPTGGLGMNTGIGDAVDLSWKLAGSLRGWRSEEHTSELQSRLHLVCRLLLEKKKTPSPPVQCACAARSPHVPPGRPARRGS